jgi:hypothetical protein
MKPSDKSSPKVQIPDKVFDGVCLLLQTANIKNVKLFDSGSLHFSIFKPGSDTTYELFCLNKKEKYLTFTCGLGRFNSIELTPQQCKRLEKIYSLVYYNLKEYECAEKIQKLTDLVKNFSPLNNNV